MAPIHHHKSYNYLQTTSNISRTGVCCHPFRRTCTASGGVGKKKKGSLCCTWTPYWWHGHGPGEASTVNTLGLSRAGVRAPLTAANHRDGSVWLRPSLPGVCSEASCQSHTWPDAWAHLQGKSFRSVKPRSYSVTLEDGQSITKILGINVMALYFWVNIHFNILV